MVPAALTAALALGHHAALEWHAPDACISGAALADAVTAKLGGAPAADEAIELVIRADLEAASGGWHATIDTRDAHGELLGHRELREKSADCRAIDDKLVLVIALIVDPDLLDKPPALPPAPPPIAVTARAVAPPSPGWRTSAAVGALASAGMLPGIALGTSLALVLEPPHGWPIELAAIAWPYDRGYAAPGGARFFELTAGAALCPRVARGFSVCGGLQAGAVRAAGFGYDSNQHILNAVADATLVLRVDWPIAPGFFARGEVASWIPLSRPRFVFSQTGVDVPVYQPAITAVVTQIALAMRF